jgi:rare lipoprotein A (peptidoglycan hydrolase)
MESLPRKHESLSERMPVALHDAQVTARANFGEEAARAFQGDGNAIVAAMRSHTKDLVHDVPDENSGKYCVGGKFEGVMSYYGKQHVAWKDMPYESGGFTAAHRTLPFGTELKVTNQSNGKTVNVTINDSGPYKPGRSLDVSSGAARGLGMTESGLARFSAEVVRLGNGPFRGSLRDFQPDCKKPAK